jgi:hypothetical protein
MAVGFNSSAVIGAITAGCTLVLAVFVAVALERIVPRDWLERVVSSLVNHANRFDADVARVERAFRRLRKVFAAIQRARDTYKREQDRDNVLWQHYLKERWRHERRRRAAWLFKFLVRSLLLLVLATCRALGSGAIWILAYSSRLILAQSSALFTGARSVPGNAAQMHGTRLAKLAPAAAIAVAALVPVGMLASSKSSAPVEISLAVRPAPQETASFTAAKGKPVQERIETAPSPSAAPGFAPVAVSTETVLQPMPEWGPGISDMVLPTATPPASKPTPSSGDATATAVPEPRPQPRAATPSASSPATTAAPAPAAPRRTASAVRNPSADQPETTSEPPQRRPTNPDRGIQRRDFVPHAFW